MAEADRLSARAVELWTDTDEESGRADAPSVRADALAAAGRYGDAATLYAQAITRKLRLYGATNPDITLLQLKHAGTLARLGHTDDAVREALEAERIGRDHLRLMVRSLPERMAVTYAATRPNGLNLAASSVGSIADAGRAALFDATIRVRASVLDELVARRRASLDERGETPVEAWNALKTARERLAFLAVAGPEGRTPAQYAALVNQAQREKELAERALASSSAAFSAQLARNDIGLENVRAALPQRAALVSFSRYVRQSDGAPAYLVFVLRSDTGLDVIPLDDAQPIDTAIDRWHRLASSAAGLVRDGVIAESAYRVAGDRLRQLIWDPVVSHLAAVDRVFVVPDSALNLVNLSALPVGRASYLVEQLPVIHYLAAERDLVALRASTTAPAKLLAIGGAAFDASTSPATARGQRRGVGPCVTLDTLRFSPLAATTREVTGLAALWPPDNSTVLTGARATERAFKERAPGSRVLHLATHGFFLPADCDAPVAGTRSVGGLSATVKKAAPASPVVLNAPLLLSGLAFAGANRRATARTSDDDGILTAEEVATLNLEGVEWAVLSACDTGLGQISAGEGVFGLRRALQIAGVRTIIMSLWSVEDQSTRDWMKALYEARLKQQLDTPESVRAASLKLLEDRRKRGVSTHPFYWAAFVAAGDWR